MMVWISYARLVVWCVWVVLAPQLLTAPAVTLPILELCLCWAHAFVMMAIINMIALQQCAQSVTTLVQNVSMVYNVQLATIWSSGLWTQLTHPSASVWTSTSIQEISYVQLAHIIAWHVQTLLLAWPAMQQLEMLAQTVHAWMGFMTMVFLFLASLAYHNV